MELMKTKNMKKNLPFLAILLIVGIIFLFLSEYTSNEQNKNGAGTEFDPELYAKNLEERLGAILEEMEGVSQAKVMITLEGGQEYRYATEVNAGLYGGNSGSETLFVQKDSSGKSSPILAATLAPKIKGVSVVCKGAADVRIQKKIIELVASTLNLSQNQIFVTE